MSVVQSQYSNRMQPNTLTSVWLVVDVPGRAAERAEELREALEKYAREWIADADRNIYAMGQEYKVESGKEETGKLTISVRLR